MVISNIEMDHIPWTTIAQNLEKERFVVNIVLDLHDCHTWQYRYPIRGITRSLLGMITSSAAEGG